MTGLDRREPSLAYPAGLRFPDVEPEVLAREAAAEPAQDALPWPAGPRRTPDRQPCVGDG